MRTNFTTIAPEFEGPSQDSVDRPLNVPETLPRHYRVGRWMRNHPLIVLGILILVSFCVEYFSLPGKRSLEELRRINPKTTALMEARRQQKGSSWKPAHRWIPLSSVSPHLIHAVIVAEDGTFYTHEGVDWYEVQESIERNWDRGRVVRGASTITQQLAKNLFLSTSRDPIRKLKEYVITKRLESALSKNRILELYLNLIEWGDGVFGVEAASWRYFGKSASGLTRDESARLASVIPSPLKHSPVDSSRFVLHRTKIILERMEARGW